MQIGNGMTGFRESLFCSSLWLHVAPFAYAYGLKLHYNLIESRIIAEEYLDHDADFAELQIGASMVILYLCR